MLSLAVKVSGISSTSKTAAVCMLPMAQEKEVPCPSSQKQNNNKNLLMVLLHVWELRVIGNLEAFWENFFPFLFPFFHYIFT